MRSLIESFFAMFLILTPILSKFFLHLCCRSELLPV